MLRAKLLAMSLLLAIGLSNVGFSAIVYQNMTSMAIVSYRMASGASSSLIFGDQVSLTGTDRQVQQIRSIVQVQGTGLGAYNFNMSVSFRNLDGTGGTPGTLIAPTQTFTFNNVAEGTGGTAAAYNITLPINNVVVPDNFAVLFQFTRAATGNTGGVGVLWNAVTPAVGNSSPTFFWRESLAGSGVYQQFNFGGTNANMALEITAVPEPASLTMLGVAGLGGFGIVRRRLRKTVKA